MSVVQVHLSNWQNALPKNRNCDTHGGFLGAIFRYVLNIPLDAERNFVLLNCSVNRLEKSENGWNLVSWGDISHLEGMNSLDDS